MSWKTASGFIDGRSVSKAALARNYGVAKSDNGSELGGNYDATNPVRGGLFHGSLSHPHSPGLRTSPVKRGYWVVKRVLGENIPPPPPNVPELPDDETSWAT